MIELPAQPAVLSRRRAGLAISERRLLLGGLDLAAVSLAFVAAFNLRTAVVRDAGFYVPRLGLAIVCALWLASAGIADAYDLRAAVSLRGSIRAVSTALGLCFIGLLGVFLLLPYRITRPTLLLWLPFAAAGLVAGRMLYRRVFAGGYLAGRIILVMDPAGLERVWPEVRPHIGGLYRMVGVIDPARPDCGERMRRIIETRAADQIVIGLRDEMSRDLFRAVLGCHDAGITVRSLGDLYEELTGRLLLDQLGHTWLMSLPMRNQTSRVYAAFKRGLDIVAASVALLGLAVLLPVVALLTRLEDGGPVFHRQTRVGKYGREFTLYKLRSMRAAGHGPGAWTTEQDPRITRVGRVLRRLHLDELPQAWSILRGEMSVIGPRPEQPAYVDELRRQIDFYNTRLTVRPGLTGWAQVNYGYGSGVDGTRVKLSYDLYYVKRQSATLDLLVLGRTLTTVLSLGGR